MSSLSPPLLSFSSVFVIHDTVALHFEVAGQHYSAVWALGSSVSNLLAITLGIKYISLPWGILQQVMRFLIASYLLHMEVISTSRLTDTRKTDTRVSTGAP